MSKLDGAIMKLRRLSPSNKKRSMKPLKKSWQDRISGALELGHFIRWNEGQDFIGELEEVHQALVVFAKKQPREAIEYFEIFLGGCLVKGNEVGDSGGEMGMFIEELSRSWARCCSAAKMPPSEFLRKIAHWIKADDIGFCHNMEETIIPALSADYRGALRDALEQRLQEKPSNDSKQQYHYRSSLVTLKKLLISTKNTTALIEAGERYGFSPEDCLALATTFNSRKQTDKALEWAERGLKCDAGQNSHHVYDLERLKRQLLAKSGRRGEAVDDAWKQFEKSPSIYSFKEVLACASRSDKAELTAKAVTLFEKADIQHAIEALYELGKIECLVQRIDRTGDEELKKLFYVTAVSVAKSIAKKFSSQAARLYVTQALNILDALRSKAYYHAHEYLSEAKVLLERAGENELWLKIVAEIRHVHRQKPGFMPGFEAIVANHKPLLVPTFMERIANKLDQGEG